VKSFLACNQPSEHVQGADAIGRGVCRVRIRRDAVEPNLAVARSAREGGDLLAGADAGQTADGEAAAVVGGDQIQELVKTTKPAETWSFSLSYLTIARTVWCSMNSIGDCRKPRFRSGPGDRHCPGNNRIGSSVHGALSEFRGLCFQQCGKLLHAGIAQGPPRRGETRFIPQRIPDPLQANIVDKFRFREATHVQTESNTRSTSLLSHMV
jgi:hypothetical protein